MKDTVEKLIRLVETHSTMITTQAKEIKELRELFITIKDDVYAINLDLEKVEEKINND